MNERSPWHQVLACPLILAKYNNLPLKISQPINEYLHHVEDFNIK